MAMFSALLADKEAEGQLPQLFSDAWSFSAALSLATTAATFVRRSPATGGAEAASSSLRGRVPMGTPSGGPTQQPSLARDSATSISQMSRSHPHLKAISEILRTGDFRFGNVHFAAVSDPFCEALGLVRVVFRHREN